MSVLAVWTAVALPRATAEFVAFLKERGRILVTDIMAVAWARVFAV